MTRASINILDLGGGDDGHRAQYFAFLGQLFAIRRVRLNWQVLTDPNPVLVPTTTSDEIQYQNATLTANRTITMPNTGLYEGMAFHIVRRATAPGAFALQVTDPIGANNYTFASASNGYVKYRAKSGAWRIVEAGTV